MREHNLRRIKLPPQKDYNADASSISPLFELRLLQNRNFKSSPHDFSLINWGIQWASPLFLLSYFLTLIGQFRIHFNLYCKAGLCVKSLLRISVFIHIEIRTNYRNNFSHLARLTLKERPQGTPKWSLTATFLDKRATSVLTCSPE